MRREELRAARRILDQTVGELLTQLNGAQDMACQGKTTKGVCGHSVTQHEGDESGMGGPEPCMAQGCDCEGYVHAPSERPAIDWANRDPAPGGIGPYGRHSVPKAEYKTEPGKTVTKWADQAMFTAEPIDADEGPKVHLLWMTADPLAAIAGPSKMYKGETVRSFRDVTHAERQEFVQEIMKTKLQMPFEAVKFHFVIEGVTRAFTHQMVRQRTAAYAQRSDRFAVQEDGIPVALPPSLAGTTGVWREHEQRAIQALNNTFGGEYEPGDPLVEKHLGELMVRESEVERQRWSWDQAVDKIFASYSYLVGTGVPQEDARGLLPTNLLTTIHYITDLRALLDHGGNRLCTQAQFEWRLVFSRIRQAIREYNPYEGLEHQLRNLGEVQGLEAVKYCGASDRWQYETIAGLFRPVCYLTGKCEFKANFDRKCNIRERVDKFAARNVPSDQWAPQHDGRTLHNGYLYEGINAAEWLLDPGAAR